MSNRKIDKTIKDEFKILRDNEELVYLNSSSTSLKLDSVLEKMFNVYQNRETTLGRSSLEKLGDNVSEVNATFKAVANHLNAPSEDIMLTYGTTYAINIIAYKIISSLNDGDEILLGTMEHAANILPWKKIAEELNKKIVFNNYPLNDRFEVDYEKLKSIITDKTKVIAVAHVYNTVGTKNDLSRIRESVGDDVIIFVDGAQAISHIKIDITEGNIDYYVFGTHKGFGPYGIGFAYVKNLYKLQEPYLYGGGIDVTYNENEIIYKDGKGKFLAGTLDVPAIISYKEAIDFIESIGLDEIEEHNNSLKEYAEKRLIDELPNARVINEGLRSPNLFFEIKGVAGEDVGYHLSQSNISVRTGASCVKITNGSYEPYKAIRASFHIYNTKEDADKLIEALKTGGDFLDALFSKRGTSEICK